MANSNRIRSQLSRDLFVMDDETNPRGSKYDRVWPSTVLDQVYDQDTTSDTYTQTLREILEGLRYDIRTGGKGNIVFPVTSVNEKTGDIIIDKSDVGLGKVDNTHDMDKPLSVPQREAVLEMLQGYNFNDSDWVQQLHSHLLDHNNPHGVNIDQLNQNHELDDLISRFVSTHNLSRDAHADIRRNITRLWSLVDSINTQVTDRIDTALNVFINHPEDGDAHAALFALKEDKSNKVVSFSSENINYQTYPSTAAVYNYVRDKVQDVQDKMPTYEHVVSDIGVVNDRSELPPASLRMYRKMYFIRYGIDSLDEIAICRVRPGVDINNLDAYLINYQSIINSDDNTSSPDNEIINSNNIDGLFYWDIIQMGTYSKFDSYFIDTPDGMSLNISNIAQGLFNNSLGIGARFVPMSEQTIRDIVNGNTRITEPGNSALLNTIINSGANNPDDTTSGNGVRKIAIIPGTIDGTIRYYINDDMTTMSEDIHVSGLQRLAFMEYVTEDEIYDQAVWGRHIISSAIETRHIQDMAVIPDKIAIPYGYMLANTNNETKAQANLVPFERMAHIFNNYIDYTQYDQGLEDINALKLQVNEQRRQIEELQNRLNDIIVDIREAESITAEGERLIVN